MSANFIFEVSASTKAMAPFASASARFATISESLYLSSPTCFSAHAVICSVLIFILFEIYFTTEYRAASSSFIIFNKFPALNILQTKIGSALSFAKAMAVSSITLISSLIAFS